MHACLMRGVGVWAGQGAAAAAHQRARPTSRRSTTRGGCSASCSMRWGTATSRGCTTGTLSQRMYCSAQVSARRYSRRYSSALSSTCCIVPRCCEWAGTGRQPLAHRQRQGLLGCQLTCPPCPLACPPCLPARPPILPTDGAVKLSDFGLGVLPNPGGSGGGGQDSLLRTTCGTPNYVAPEVLAKRGYLGGPADVWSLGELDSNAVCSTGCAYSCARAAAAVRRLGYMQPCLASTSCLHPAGSPAHPPSRPTCLPTHQACCCMSSWRAACPLMRTTWWRCSTRSAQPSTRFRPGCRQMLWGCCGP